MFTLSDQPGDDVFELITVVPQYEHAESGWSSFFDRMAERLAHA